MDRDRSSEQPERTSLYDWLVQEESKPAFPDDEILITLDEATKQELSDLGISWGERKAISGKTQVNFNLGHVLREDLLNADVVFINRLSRDNEKPILSGKVSLSGETVNLEDHQFLTSSDMEKIRQYQQEHRGEQIDFEEVRRAACDFTERAVQAYNDRERIPEEFVQSVYEELAQELSAEDREKLEKFRHPATKRAISVFEKSYFHYLLGILETEQGNIAGSEEDLRAAFSERFPRLSQEHPDLLDETIAKIMEDPANWTQTLSGIKDEYSVDATEAISSKVLMMRAGIEMKQAVGGVLFDATPVRHSSLQGVPSPFLDSGFVFGGNNDLTLYFPDGRERRLNTAVVHLWSQELDEMGGSRDQIYVTAEEFQELMQTMEEDDNASPFSTEDRSRLKKIIKREALSSPEELQRRRERERKKILKQLRSERD